MTKQTNGFAKAKITDNHGHTLHGVENLVVGQSYQLVISFTPQATMPQTDQPTQIQVIPFTGEVIGIIICHGFDLEKDAFVLRIKDSTGEVSIGMIANHDVAHFSFNIELLHKNTPISNLKLSYELTS